MPSPVATTAAALAVSLTAAICPSAANAQVRSHTQSVHADAVEEEPVRNIEEWNLPGRGERLAISGYDPVAYFPEGGGEPAKGRKSIAATHEGVTYRFATTDNRDRFLASPDRYEPAHGGWCSYAMLEGGKTAPNPKTFIVEDDRLFLYYNAWGTNTRSLWQRGDHDAQAAAADARWLDVSGESKRQVALDDE